MKKYEQLSNSLDDLNTLLDGAALTDGKQEFVNHYKALIQPLRANLASEKKEENKIIHLGSLLALTRLHHEQIYLTLSRTNSNVSYARSFVQASAGDKYYDAVGKILESLEEVFFFNLEHPAKNYLAPNYSQGNQKTFQNLGSTLAAQGAEPASSFMQLEKRLFIIAITDSLKSMIPKAKTEMAQKLTLINLAVYGMLGPVATVVSGAVSTTFAGSNLKTLNEIQSVLDSIPYDESLVKWRQQGKAMLTNTPANEAALKLFETHVVVNADILSELKKHNISLDDVETIWPFEQNRTMYCPILRDFLVDPVSLGLTGHTFNRTSIVEALKNRPGIDPVSNAPIDSTALVSNHAVRDMILDKIREYAKSEKRSALVVK